MSRRLFRTSIFTLTFSSLIALQNTAHAKIEKILGTPVAQNPNIAFSLPETDQTEIIVSRDQYIISYNKQTRVPNYVAWKLQADLMGSSRRSNNFNLDTELDQYLLESSNLRAVDAGDYRGSCYDRGHQVPSADRTDSPSNNEMTFLMSNMIPQTAYLNRVIWKHLEQYSRDLVQKQGKKLFIIAGPIFDKPMGAIGPHHDIQVPSKNFKIIYILDEGQAPETINERTPNISVIIPNILQSGSTDLSDKKELCKPLTSEGLDKKDWEKFKTTLDEVEKLSGLHFAQSFKN